MYNSHHVCGLQAEVLPPNYDGAGGSAFTELFTETKKEKKALLWLKRAILFIHVSSGAPF